MSSRFTSRIEVLLAKIAGKEASLETMCPPWPANLSEKLMMDIADRMDGVENNGLPEVTSIDIGKGLSAQQTCVPGEVIVPSQVAESNPEAMGGGVYDIKNPVFDLFIPGTQIIAVINGETYVSTVYEDETDAYIASCGIAGTGNAIFEIVRYMPIQVEGVTNEERMYVVSGDYDPPPESIAISVNVANIDYRWMVDPYPAYDAVIKLGKATVDSGNNTAELVKGSFEALQAKALAKDLMSVAVFGAEDNATKPRTTTFFTANVTYSTGAPGAQDAQPEILVSVIQYGGMQGQLFAASTEGGSPTQRFMALSDMTRAAVLYINSNNEVGWK